jgi:Cu-processing system permease protein
MMRKVRSISWLVILDGLRRRALLGLIILAISLEIGGLLFVDFIPREVGRASVDFILSVGWLTGFLFLLFHAVKVAAWEDERRTIECILSRPVSRRHYVLGTFLGLAILLLLLNISLGVIGQVILLGIQEAVGSAYFASLHQPSYILSWLGLYAVELMVLSIIFLFSSLVRGGFPVLLLTVAYCLICNGLPVVREMFTTAAGGEGGKLIPVVLQSLSTVFPDFHRYDFREMVIATDSVLTLKMVFVAVLMIVLYTTLALWLSSVIYSRRDLQ